MSAMETNKGYLSPQDMLTIPGAIIGLPPAPEKRLYYVPHDPEAYERPATNEGRTAAEISDGCLGRDSDLLLNPDLNSQNIFRLRRQLGSEVMRFVLDTLADETACPSDRYEAIEQIPYLQPPEKRREVALSVLDDESSNGACLSASTKNLVSKAFDANGSDIHSVKITELESSRMAMMGNENRAHVIPESPLRTKTKKLLSKAYPHSLMRSPLHRRAGDEVIKFEKTGTDTYILPKDYEASVRVIPVAAATAWFEAFQNWPEWYGRGFNYVPIEPIQDIAQTDESKMVAVTTTNLRGKELWTVVDIMPQHKNQLYEMREEIRSGLSSMNVSHHHLHDGNFVVVPYANRSGRPDLERCPRLYAIDFDKAEIIR